ncbi:MAG: spore coat associated protein CotJA [Clostridia bacterium]|nr:spore coat associated protein CotJA [Clostridia bacterium]
MERKQMLDDMPVAMAYVPWQEWGCLFDLDEALRCGTLFKSLFKPFMGGAR